ncbi:MAG TPA: hypothetical protein VN653_10910 [Anaerolineales bacterium]|nr:hypothetical protein [Anaerolineales bacterium]
MSRYDEPCNPELFPVLKTADNVIKELSLTLAAHGIDFWFEVGSSSARACSIPFTFARIWQQLENLKQVFTSLGDEYKLEKMKDLQEILSGIMGCRAGLANDKINRHYGLMSDIEKAIEQKEWLEGQLKTIPFEPWKDEPPNSGSVPAPEKPRTPDPFAGVVKT